MEDGIGYSNYIQVKKKKALDSRAKKKNKLAICFTQKRLLQTYKGGYFLPYSREHTLVRTYPIKELLDQTSTIVFD